MTSQDTSDQPLAANATSGSNGSNIATYNNSIVNTTPLSAFACGRQNHARNRTTVSKMTWCFVLGCLNQPSTTSRNAPDEPVRYYSFPAHPIIRQQWLAFCGYRPDEFAASANMCVCSAHFNFNSPDSPALSPDSVPTIKPASIICRSNHTFVPNLRIPNR